MDTDTILALLEVFMWTMGTVLLCLVVFIVHRIVMPKRLPLSTMIEEKKRYLDDKPQAFYSDRR